MKKRASKVAHNRPRAFYFTAQTNGPQPRIDFSYYEISGPDICSLICGWAEKCVGCDTIWIPWISIKVMTRNLELAEEVRVDRSRKTTFINECVRISMELLLRILKFGHCSILEQIHKSFFLLLLITLLLTLYVEKNSNFSLNVQSLCWHFENRLGIIFDEVCYQH